MALNNNSTEGAFEEEGVKGKCRELAYISLRTIFQLES